MLRWELEQGRCACEASYAVGLWAVVWVSTRSLRLQNHVEKDGDGLWLDKEGLKWNHPF